MGRKKALLLLGYTLIVVGVSAVGIRHFSHKSTPVDSASTQTTPQTTKAPAPQNLVGNYFISGDVFWGRGIDYYAQRSAEKYNWPFSRLSEFGRDKQDAWITDLECPVNNKNVPYQTQVDSLIFSCSPDYLSVASKWFNAFTLANNHTGNTGVDGFAQTQTNLAQAGFQFFGHYDLAQANDLCEVISLPVYVGTAKQQLPIAMCGYHWLARQPTDAELAKISEYAAYMPVWVFAHGGTEYAIASNAAQHELYRKMIDLGADVVFGDHPHVIQDTEAYKGKLIVYSLGNLIFDQWFDQEVTKSLIVNVHIKTTVNSSVQKWVDLAPSCAQFKDDCLARAKTGNYLPIKLNYTYDIIAGDSANTPQDRPKHLGSPAVQAWLATRTNWSTTLAGLK
jgi:poly-gamma-glutamate synthesis protein (capsule biosynthesis protein)